MDDKDWEEEIKKIAESSGIQKESRDIANLVRFFSETVRHLEREGFDREESIQIALSIFSITSQMGR